ncbi:hypothetical protein [Ruminococcus sp.]
MHFRAALDDQFRWGEIYGTIRAFETMHMSPADIIQEISEIFSVSIEEAKRMYEWSKTNAKKTDE